MQITEVLAARIERRNRQRAAAARQLRRYFNSRDFAERYLADKAVEVQRELDAYFASSGFGHAANLAASA